MSRRYFFAALVFFAVGARAAELKHDLYVCVNLSGQGSVMGRSGPLLSGLYRSEDRENFEHLGPHHIRTFSVTHDPSDPARLYIALLDGVLRTPDRGKTFRIVTSWDMTEAKSISVDRNRSEHVYAGIPDGSHVYFVHSFYPQPTDSGIVATRTEHGDSFASSVWRDNVFATQFHPEKSQTVGLRLLKNFVDLAG